MGSETSGNSNPSVDTRFGGPKAPARGENSKPYSIRHSIRWAAFANLSYKEIKDLPEEKLVEKILGKDIATPAEIGACRQMARYLQNCTEAQFLSEQVDGKLANTNIHADLDAVKNMTEDQLDEYIRSGGQSATQAERAGGGGDNGTQPSAIDQRSVSETPGG